MTRPHIIRADTLDLQDKSSPTAKDHSQQPEHPAPLGIGPAAPHQQASLRHVEEERNSEEARLQNAWSNAGDQLRDDPGSDDDRTVVKHGSGQKGAQHNGGASGDGDDSDLQDADVEEDMDDDDDDMMDKISSSPSIDDGGCSLPFYPATWPQRIQSLTPESSPMPSAASSSPFTTTPIHFPISVASARRPCDVPAPDISPISTFSFAPATIPISLRSTQKNDSQSTEHHPGEYDRTRTTPELEDDTASELDITMSPRSRMRGVIERRLHITRRHSLASTVSSLDENESHSLLEPITRPVRLRDLRHFRPEISSSKPLSRSLRNPKGPARLNNSRQKRMSDERASPTVRTSPSSMKPISLDFATDEHRASRMFKPTTSPGTLSRPTDYNEDPFSDDEFSSDQNDDPFSDHNEDAFSELTKSPPRTANGTPPPAKYPDEEGDSWTTDSDADSWDEAADKHDDASNDVSFSEDERFIDSGWGGECLRETEDIDFEFVYALHTFVATVEGQANATKGDTMVLLDDSNSYWWLVRVVKDSSIGYLPAEHIETPTERLARLNKHRNIDLSATMLGDTAEKSKNPLKKAMRRRNAKTVQFAPPTYVEASDYDYSSDEGEDELFGGPEPKQAQQQQQQDAQQAEPESQDDLKVQPLKLGGTKKDGKNEGDVEDATQEPERQRGSEDGIDKPLDPKVTRNGTVRNTDSFFKDENTETRKITLTPNLLRDDSSTSTTGSRERGPSLESLEKNGFADKVKDDKKKKEKKAGMLSGLFKRKEKKPKGQLDSFDSDMEKMSEEVDRTSPQPKPSDESTERPSAEQGGPQRSTSKGKLQKATRNRDESPQKTKGILKTESPTEATSQQVAAPDATDSKPSGQQSSTMRLVPSEQDDAKRPAAEEKTMGSMNPFKSSQVPQDSNAKPEKVKKAKQRVQLDDFDSSDEDSDPFADPDAQNRAMQPDVAEPAGRLSESPVHVSAADAQPNGKIQVRERELDVQQPPGLAHDNSSQETSSPVSTPTPDDSPMKTIPENTTVSTFRSEDTASPTHRSPITGTNGIPPPSRPAPVPAKAERELQSSPPSSSESTQLPAWSDAALRAYLDDGSDVRDMLIVVNDTTGVVPVGRDHPIMSTLFVEESKTVQGMSNELDRLLSGLMEKRMKRNVSAASKASTSRSANGTVGAMR